MLKNILFLAGLSLFVVVIFIAGNLIMESRSTTISPSTLKNATPIDGSFNTEVISQLKSRVEVPVDLSSQANISAPQPNTSQATRSAQVSSTITPRPTRTL